MAFTGSAATVYEKSHGDAINATAEELWEKMEKWLYNDGQVQAQRSKFHTARLGTNETIDDFAQRIRDLRTGLPEASEDAMLLQRFMDGLKTTLKLQSLAISAGFDEVVPGSRRCLRSKGRGDSRHW
jgi:Retrotransposon gag protein